jgi:DNA-directed RNA polymerase subunit RPC12/RpoP
MIYTCITCDKTFKQKSGFTDHLNRKNPCIKIPKNIHQITPNYTNLTPKLHQITPTLHQNYTKLHQITQKAENRCNYCYNAYCRPNVLKKHLLICKVKKQEIYEKEDILNKLLEQNNKLALTIEELNKKIDKLENNTINHHTQNNKNIKNQNNGISNTINIIGFGKEDLSKIDNASFFEALMQMGYNIPTKMLEKIHINEKYPEYKNIYISDINRGNAMIYDGKKWKLDKYDNISDKLLDKVLHFIEERYDEIKDDTSISEKKKTNMENRLRILEIMKDYEEEKERKRHEYLRNQCKDKIKIDLYNNRESIAEENPKTEDE